jgi:hypothetical protein
MRHNQTPPAGDTVSTVAVMREPIEHGWAVTLTDGRELARFVGPGAKRRALRYLAANGLWRHDRGEA